jgi:hypothetical protein
LVGDDPVSSGQPRPDVRQHLVIVGTNLSPDLFSDLLPDPTLCDPDRGLIALAGGAGHLGRFERPGFLAATPFTLGQVDGSASLVLGAAEPG